MTLRIFKAKMAIITALVQSHCDIPPPDMDYKFAYAVIKAQLSINKDLRAACMSGEMTPSLLEGVLRELGAEEYVHVVHNMSAEEEDFQKLQEAFREIAHLWYK